LSGIGLATAYYNRVSVLPNGRVLIRGGPGVVAYGPDTKHVWTRKPSFYELVFAEGRELVIGYFYERATATSPALTVLGAFRYG
jgi:hypothetical protein